MFGSLKLGKLFGIDLFLHGTFWLLPLFVLFHGVAEGDVAGAGLDVLVLFAVFGCVVLHEVGHALAARYYGIGTRDITLYPIGGVASLERMPDRPWQEIVIALAGPLVNVVIAAGILGGVAVRGYVLPSVLASAELSPTDLILGRVFWANVFLVLFNLIPAFPMDGGRVLRALLSLGLPRLDATRVAVTVGSVLAAVGVFVGLIGIDVGATRIGGGNFSLALVSGVIFLLGQAELAAVRVQEARKRWRQRYAGFYDEPDDAEPVATGTAGPFSGWRWDPGRRVWSEWRDGVLVREVYGA
jgi:Zn-dependent protease